MVFGLQIWIMLHFTGLDWKSYGQQFIITLIRYFSAVELEITQTMNLEYDYQITGFGLENPWTVIQDCD